MRWLIVSGALHNFCLYALSSFMTPYLMRYHELDVRDANFGSMLINGVFTIPGILLGGFLGDRAKRRQSNGALILVAGVTLGAVPLFVLAIAAGPHDIYRFIYAMGGAFALMYFYYSTVYATIQDVISPQLRGTAMAIYFMAMYLIGGALGPFTVGALSDLFTRRAAGLAGITDITSAASLEPFRASGLNTAMYAVPILAFILAVVLLAAARSASRELPEHR
jgi:MFS family permease